MNWLLPFWGRGASSSPALRRWDQLLGVQQISDELQKIRLNRVREMELPDARVGACPQGVWVGALTSAPLPWGRSWSIMSILQVAKLRQRRLSLCRVMRPFRENERPSYSLWGTLTKLVSVLLFRGMGVISYLARMMAFVKPMLGLIFYAFFLKLSHRRKKVFYN